MKASKAAVSEPDFKIWCEQCSIRIAPNEERIMNNGKIYHTQCHSKLFATDSNQKKTTLSERG